MAIEYNISEGRVYASTIVNNKSKNKVYIGDDIDIVGYETDKDTNENFISISFTNKFEQKVTIERLPRAELTGKMLAKKIKADMGIVIDDGLYYKYFLKKESFLLSGIGGIQENRHMTAYQILSNKGKTIDIYNINESSKERVYSYKSVGWFSDEADDLRFHGNRTIGSDNDDNAKYVGKLKLAPKGSLENVLKNGEQR